MQIRSLKLPKDLDARLAKRARRTGLSCSAVVRDALTHYLEIGSPRERERPSFLEAAADLIGAGDGPSDLSTHPKYMDDLGR